MARAERVGGVPARGPGRGGRRRLDFRAKPSRIPGAGVRLRGRGGCRARLARDVRRRRLVRAGGVRAPSRAGLDPRRCVSRRRGGIAFDARNRRARVPGRRHRRGVALVHRDAPRDTLRGILRGGNRRVVIRSRVPTLARWDDVSIRIRRTCGWDANRRGRRRVRLARARAGTRDARLRTGGKDRRERSAPRGDDDSYPRRHERRGARRRRRGLARVRRPPDVRLRPDVRPRPSARVREPRGDGSRRPPDVHPRPRGRDGDRLRNPPRSRRRTTRLVYVWRRRRARPTRQ